MNTKMMEVQEMETDSDMRLKLLHCITFFYLNISSKRLGETTMVKSKVYVRGSALCR